MLNSTEHEISTAKKKYLQMKKFLALSLSNVVFIMLINVKMSTIVGILTFMSRINFMLIWVEHGKKFYNLRASPLPLSLYMTEILFLGLFVCKTNKQTECSGSLVECLTQDRGAAGSSLTGVTAFCAWARHIDPSLVLVQSMKTRQSLYNWKIVDGT